MGVPKNPYLTPPLTPANKLKSKPSSPSKPPTRRKYQYIHDEANPVITLTPSGLAPISLHLDEYFVYLFFRFMAERHRMQVRRVYEGVPKDQLSPDETMTKTFVGNVYRELDAGSVRNREKIIGVGVQSHEEICCQSSTRP